MNTMTIKLFEEISLYIGIGTLALYLLFMLYDLTKQAKGGSYGLWVIFLILGLGVSGFVVKSVIELTVLV